VGGIFLKQVNDRFSIPRETIFMKSNILNSLLAAALLAACVSQPERVAETMSPNPPTRIIGTSTQASEGLWVGSAVPESMRNAAKAWGINLVGSSNRSKYQLDVAAEGSKWIYALVAPFPTAMDDVLFADLISTWEGVPAGRMAGRALLMTDTTLEAFTGLWGSPAAGAVRTVPADLILDIAWKEMPSWAIIPFEEIQPKWKVLTVDGQSPVRRDFDPETYPLVVHFSLSPEINLTLPETNRDPEKLVTVILTGVTALVRATAVTMELKGVTYPGSLIGDWLREADIAHISNEVPFDKDCPFPSPGHRNFILCSNPNYLDLLLDVGVDIVELTGDHFADRGTQAMFDTLALYDQYGIPYYGGGANALEAQQPLLLEVNGTNLAFMGCNGKRSGKYPKATSNTPGAADCDYDFFEAQIRTLSSEGYLVIFTFQHEECYSSGPCFSHESGFHAVADAGATVVSGSQAHYPHIMEFRGDSFIHYGLGNLFFDQMTYPLEKGLVIDQTRREYLDRHVFYDGRYLGVELLTAMLEDFARPRPMNEREREAFLLDYFYFSGFTPFSPTPLPQPTITLTPIQLP
jgi:poly-gamma-glutamate synthesis protein (capsule biosynthesis protein)